MTSFFSYKNGNTVLHRMNVLLKLFFLLLFSFTAFFLPINFCLLFCIFSIVVFLALRFPITDFFSIWKIIFYYSLILFFSFLIQLIFDKTYFTNLKNDLHILLKLIFTLHISSIFYKTTTILELKNAFEKIELFLMKKIFCKRNYSPKISLYISLLLMFLPLIFNSWNTLKNSWALRGGKTNIKMIITLFPSLISLCIKKSLTTVSLLENRDL